MKKVKQKVKKEKDAASLLSWRVTLVLFVVMCLFVVALGRINEPTQISL